MKKIQVVILILTFVSNILGSEPDAKKLPKTWVVIVSGINKDPDEKQSKAKAVIGLKEHFQNRLAVAEDHLFVLTDKESLIYGPETLEATFENIEQLFNTLSEKVQPSDSFIYYYVGQANVVKDKLRFNFSGPDLLHDQLVVCLDKVKAEKLLVILDCPSAGMAIKSLQKHGRIIICGAQANQSWSTKFSQYFVPAMSNVDADFNQDQEISILEAFRYAVLQIDDYYDQRNLFKTENALLEDDHDGVPSQQPWTTEKKKDGKVAGQWIVCRLDN